MAGGEWALISKIGNMFSEEDFLSNRPLDRRFLLGYYCQQYVMEKEWEEPFKKKELSTEEDV